MRKKTALSVKSVQSSAQSVVAFGGIWFISIDINKCALLGLALIYRMNKAENEGWV
jgi:hypothetical protein